MLLMRALQAIQWAVETQDADIVSLCLGWEQEQNSDNDRDISNAIASAVAHRHQDVLIFAAASNFDGSKRELFPARHPTVFSIRRTNTKGRYMDFNPSLFNIYEKSFGTLGVEVPTRTRSESTYDHIRQSECPIATAVMTGIAAILIGYVNINDDKGLWGNIRTYQGFQSLLYELSTEPEERKRFVTLERYSKQEHLLALEAALERASSAQHWK